MALAKSLSQQILCSISKGGRTAARTAQLRPQQDDSESNQQTMTATTLHHQSTNRIELHHVLLESTLHHGKNHMESFNTRLSCVIELALLWGAQ